MLLATTNTNPLQPRRGMVLIAVLVVIVLLSLAAYQYSDLMLNEYRAAVNAHKALQARHFADAGIHYAAALLGNEVDPSGAGSTTTNKFDDAGTFQNVAVGDKTKGWTGKFSIIAPPDPDGDSTTAWRYGVTDEG